jgi:LuxR family maltose regulon positive regulatory protein
MASYYLANLHFNHGQLQQAAQVNRQALQWAQRQATPVLSICWTYAALGQLLYEWNRLAEARENLQQALQLAQQSGEVKVLIYSHRSLAALYQANNEFDQAQTSLRAAEGIAKQTNLVSLVEDVAVDQLLLWFKTGQLDTAVGWVQQSGYDFDVQQPQVPKNAILIRLALAQTIQQDILLPDNIISLLQQRCAHEQRIGHTWQLVQNLVVLAQAHSAAGHQTEALSTFKQALTLAEAAGFVRTIINEGAMIANLLRQCVDDPETGNYAAQLLATFDNGQAAPVRALAPPVVAPPAATLPAAAPSLAAQSLVEPLRQRELEVLHHISAGHSNQEIAEEMVLAVSTVKWHLKNIYGKLQVNRRTQALARAKELELL